VFSIYFSTSTRVFSTHPLQKASAAVSTEEERERESALSHSPTHSHTHTLTHSQRKRKKEKEKKKKKKRGIATLIATLIPLTHTLTHSAAAVSTERERRYCDHAVNRRQKWPSTRSKVAVKRQNSSARQPHHNSQLAVRSSTFAVKIFGGQKEKADFKNI
jgi:hypothetical protein